MLNFRRQDENHIAFYMEVKNNGYQRGRTEKIRLRFLKAIDTPYNLVYVAFLMALNEYEIIKFMEITLWLRKIKFETFTKKVLCKKSAL